MNYLKVIGAIRRGTANYKEKLQAIQLIRKLACGLYDAEFRKATYKTYEAIMTATEIAEDLVK